MIIALSRAGLMAGWTAVLILLFYIGKNNEQARPYAWLFSPIVAVNVVFYAMAWLFRLELFSPPGQFFFTTLSNYRSWATVITALVALIPTAYRLWTGPRSL